MISYRGSILVGFERFWGFWTIWRDFGWSEKLEIADFEDFGCSFGGKSVTLGSQRHGKVTFGRDFRGAD